MMRVWSFWHAPCGTVRPLRRMRYTSTAIRSFPPAGLPANKVKNFGKKLIGWQYKNGGNTTNFVKGEHVKFDTLKALLNGNWDNEGNAWVTLTPVFQDVKSNNGNSSSSSSSNSSSSSSSSSNKTTTASNEKQVVKAAAAPANTTKVLPKTGATNAAPLIGGSLAVVALLMGYGVYGLVLRKKD